MTDTAAAADAVEAAADAAEAAAEAAEAAADAAGNVADAADDNGGESAPPPAAAPANPEGAHDDAVQLDHEQRITRVEDALAVAVAAIGERPTYDEVRSMTPNVSEVVETAAAVAESTATAAVDEHEDDDHHDDEGDGEHAAEETIIEPTEPDSPEVNEESAPRARGFRW